MRVPLYAHESNSIPGTANKINNLMSKTTFQTFPETFSDCKKIIHSGNPIQESFSNITRPEIKYKNRKETLNILIFGGVKEQDFLIRRFQTASPNLVTNLILNIFQVTIIVFQLKEYTIATISHPMY
ncbi:MAG: hypothetical protein CM15mP53_06990 [Ectothiorhodospiraceae bacterium]|nr:MAG: hypothetical protein CM15mP53_06990 [Ectothiorhodospiraceae bacterium]